MAAEWEKFKAINGAGQTTNQIRGVGQPHGTIEVVSTGVTSGATIVVEGSISGSGWDTIATFTISANGSAFARYKDAAYRLYQARPTSYTDGTHAVHLFLHGDSPPAQYLRSEG